MRLRLSILCLAAMLVTPAAAHAAAQWQSGPLVESAGYNCITAGPEQLAGTYLSYYADPANPPKTGEVYYVAVDVAGIGNPCAGQYADIELTLPSGTSTAISAAHPVYCFLEFPGHSSFVRDSSSDCPQSTHLGAYGGLAFDPVGVNPPFWPLPQGGTVELQVPVVSSAPLNGSSKLGGIITLADGESSPTLLPTLAMIVNDAITQTGQSQIGILYPTPSITGQTTNANSSVDVNIIGYVVNHSNAGSAVAQLGQPPAGAGTNCTSPVGPKGNPGGGIFSTAAVPLATGGANLQTQITGNFTTLYPGHAYCWRIVAHIGAVEYDGNWEPFVTQGTPLAGDGTAPPTIGEPTCSATTGNGCSASPCATGGSCGSCAGAACLTSFAPGRSTVISHPAPKPPTPKPPAPVPTATISKKGKASASFSGSKVLVKTGLLAACPAGTATCKVTLSATVHGAQAAKAKTVSVGTAHATIKPGKSLSLTLKLSSRGAKLLKKHHRLTLALTVSTSVGAAAAVPVKKTIKISAPKKRAHR